MDYLIEHLAPLLVAVVALCLSLYNFAQSRRRKRRKLFSVYYHAVMAIESIEAQQKNNQRIRKTIAEDDAYTPLIASVSSANELTYQQVLDVMEWLNQEEEEATLSYFHHQSDLHALGQSFNSDFVRNWSQERKLEMWAHLEEKMEETLRHACAVKALLRAKTNFR